MSTAAASGTTTGTPGLVGPSTVLLGHVGMESAQRRGRGCVQPVRLRGRKELVDITTGQLTTLYDSATEVDGIAYVKCGNRRAAVCPPCSHEYKGDSWQ